MPLYDESGSMVSTGGTALAGKKAVPESISVPIPGGGRITGSFKTPEQKREEEAKTAVEKSAQERAQKLRELSKVVDFFEAKINEIPSGSGLWGRLRGGQVAVEAWLQTDPKAAAYVSSSNGLRAQIARGLGDVGNLNEAEQENALKLLPKVTDNDETRKQKIQNFRDFMYFKGLTAGERKLTPEKPKKDSLGILE